MAGFFSRERHGRRPTSADRFAQALSIAHGWFIDQVGEVATIQYVTVPADLSWWQPDGTAPLMSGGISGSGGVALTLHRKFIESRVTDETLLPEMLYELLITEWASLTGQRAHDVDPEF